MYSQELRPEISWQRSKDSVLVKRVINLHNNDKFKEAFNEIRKLPMKLYALDPGILSLSGSCKYEMGEFEDAITFYGLALTHDPQSVGTYYDRAFALMAAKKYKAAVSDFAAYAIHYPDNKTVINNLAHCLSMDEQVDAAIEFLVGYESKDSTPNNQLAWKYLEHTTNYTRAIDLWYDVLELNPNYRTALEGMSIAYSEMNDYAKAFYFVERLINLDPKYEQAYYLQGVYYKETGDDKKQMHAL